MNQRTLQQLKSLGYLGGSSPGEVALTGQGADPKDRLDVLKWLYLAVSPDSGNPVGQRIPLLRKAVAADPSDPTIYYHLGDEYAKAGRYADAMQLYQDGIRNGIHSAWLYSRLGYLYLRQGERDTAIASYRRAAQLNPSDCETLNDLGMAYLEGGRMDDAERSFKWCAAADAGYALAYNGLGLVSIRRQDLPGARGYFERALQLDPDLLEAQLNLGRIYKMTGATAQARQCFEAFLAKASPTQYGDVIARIRQELAGMH